jgi:hypothetical protein
MNTFSDSIKDICRISTTEPIDPSKLKPEDLKNIKIKVDIQASFDYRMAMLIKAGLKDDFIKMLEKGKSVWKSTWDTIKDKAMQAAIKGIKTVDQVKDFIVKHPELKFVIIAAIILGYLAFPSNAMADILNAPSTQALAAKLHWSFSGGPFGHTLNVAIPKGWVEDLVTRSLQDGSIKDIAQNMHAILMEKAKMMQMDPHTSSFMIDTTTEAIMKEIKNTPEIFKMLALC